MFSLQNAVQKMRIIAMKALVSVGLQGFHLHGFYFNLSFEIKLNLFLTLKCQAPFVVIVSDSSRLSPKPLCEMC